MVDRQGTVLTWSERGGEKRRQSAATETECGNEARVTCERTRARRGGMRLPLPGGAGAVRRSRWRSCPGEEGEARTNRHDRESDGTQLKTGEDFHRENTAQRERERKKILYSLFFLICFVPRQSAAVAGATTLIS